MSILSRAAAIGMASAVVILAACGQVKDSASDTAVLRAEVEQLKTQMGYLNDRQQIQDVYLRYMRGFDRNDVELMRRAFWPDAQINYGEQSNTFDEFVTRHLKVHIDTLMAWGHLLTNQTVDIDGNVAHVESYVTRLASRRKDGKSDIISGRYVDRVERRNGEWRIAMREFIPHFYTETAIGFGPRTWPDLGSTPCVMGTWDRRDPSYLRPLNNRTDLAVGPACAQ